MLRSMLVVYVGVVVYFAVYVVGYTPPEKIKKIQVIKTENKQPGQLTSEVDREGKVEWWSILVGKLSMEKAFSMRFNKQK